MTDSHEAPQPPFEPFGFKFTVSKEMYGSPSVEHSVTYAERADIQQTVVGREASAVQKTESNKFIPIGYFDIDDQSFPVVARLSLDVSNDRAAEYLIAHMGGLKYPSNHRYLYTDNNVPIGPYSYNSTQYSHLLRRPIRYGFAIVDTEAVKKSQSSQIGRSGIFTGLAWDEVSPRVIQKRNYLGDAWITSIMFDDDLGVAITHDGQNNSLRFKPSPLAAGRARIVTAKGLVNESAQISTAPQLQKQEWMDAMWREKRAEGLSNGQAYRVIVKKLLATEGATDEALKYLNATYRPKPLAPQGEHNIPHSANNEAAASDARNDASSAG